MPRSMEEHHAYLLATGAEFEPYTGRDGRPPRRDAERELARLRRYWESLPADHRDQVERLAAELPPMHENCRISVYIPARREEEFIGQTLALLLRQTDDRFRPLPEELYEIVIVNNVVEGESFDDTTEVVRRTCRELGRNNVHLTDIVYPAGTPCALTLSCRYAADLIVHRALRRPRHLAPLYIAAEDADLVWTDPRQVWTELTTLEARPELDAVRGYTDRCPWIYLSHDLVTVMRQSWILTELYFAQPRLRAPDNPDADFRWNRVTTNGWNTAFSAELYAMIRGYTPDRWMGNDADVGEKISLIRGTVTDDGVPVPRLDTVRMMRCRAEGSPRRWFLQAIDGVSPYARRNNYENFYSTRTFDRIHRGSMSELVTAAGATARIGPDNLHHFEAELSDRWATILEVRKSESAALDQMGWLMNWLGAGPDDWEPAGDRVRLHSYKRLAAALEARRRHTAGRGPWRDRPILGSAAPNWRSYT